MLYVLWCGDMFGLLFIVVKMDVMLIVSDLLIVGLDD